MTTNYTLIMDILRDAAAQQGWMNRRDVIQVLGMALVVQGIVVFLAGWVLVAIGMRPI